ncbi:hypothetical protein FNYG_14239 [Fusarium nygamai]|uniref:Uncharacterized protein n=1 Tax=Gibberella nygamai TaxID=42673 RepID=A0A2K0UTP5_GIBNY|nr:hypothetical protein FNYG_14239 [Fusarium nygamai]
MGFLVTWVIIHWEDHIEQIETKNKFVNDQNDELIESNGQLAIENEDLKKTLALAEEELTKQVEITNKLKKQLEAAKSKDIPRH